MSEPSLRVRVEEVLIGALSGALVGLTVASPLAIGVNLYSLYSLPDLLHEPRALLVYSMMLAGAIAGIRLASRQRAFEHIRGARFISDPNRTAEELRKRERAAMSVIQQSGEVSGIIVAGVELARKTETGHLLVVGLPGSGKTLLLTSIVRQALHREDIVILHDPKGDYTSNFLGFPLYTESLAGPWDKRASIWDVGADVDSLPRAQAFSRAIVGVGHGDNAFFYDNARKLLAALVLSLPRNWTWRDLYKALCGDARELVRRAAAADPTIPSTFSGAIAGEMTRAERDVISTLAHRTSWIQQIAAVDDGSRKRFSLRELLRSLSTEKKRRLLILNSNSQYALACEGLFGALLFVGATILASAETAERSADARGLWFVLDEFPQLGAEAVLAIQKVEEIGRSRGVRVVKALQDESQLAALLGPERAAPVLAMSGTKVYFRLSDRTAKAVSDRIGYRDVIAFSTTAEHGATSGKTARQARQLVVSPGDFTRLAVTDGGCEMILQRGDLLAYLIQPYGRPLQRHVPPFVESQEWLLMSEPKPTGELPEPEKDQDQEWDV